MKARHFLPFWPVLPLCLLLLFVLPSCQVFDRLQYVYLPLDNEAILLAGDHQGDLSRVEILPDGRGSSIRFKRTGPSLEDGRPAWTLSYTIVSGNMLEDLYRSTPRRFEGRVPDLLFLELYLQNRSRELNMNPYALEIHCLRMKRESIRTGPTTVQEEKGKKENHGEQLYELQSEKEIYRQVAERDYLDDYEGMAVAWIDLWHRTPRMDGTFDGDNPGPRRIWNRYHLSADQRKSMRQQELQFASRLRRPFTVRAEQSVRMFLAFPKLPPNSVCQIVDTGTGIGSKGSLWQFRTARLDEEDLAAILEQRKGYYLAARKAFVKERRLLGEEQTARRKDLRETHEKIQEGYCLTATEEASSGGLCSDFWSWLPWRS